MKQNEIINLPQESQTISGKRASNTLVLSIVVSAQRNSRKQKQKWGESPGTLILGLKVSWHLVDELSLLRFLCSCPNVLVLVLILRASFWSLSPQSQAQILRAWTWTLVQNFHFYNSEPHWCFISTSKQKPLDLHISLPCAYFLTNLKKWHFQYQPPKSEISVSLK